MCPFTVSPNGSIVPTTLRNCRNDHRHIESDCVITVAEVEPQTQIRFHSDD